MTTFRDHRTNMRTACLAHLEIDCMSCRNQEHFQGVTYNMSGEGLYVESAPGIRTGAKVIITDVRGEEGDEKCTALKGYAGVVRWARPMRRAAQQVFGYGIWLYYPDLAQGFEALADIRFYCDMCGRPVKVKELKQQMGPLWLCPRCNDSMEHLPDVLEEDLDRYLVGNVL